MRERVDWAEDFEGLFVYYDGMGRLSDLPKSYYRIELIFQNKDDHGYWSAQNGHVRDIYVELTDKNRERYLVNVRDFVNEPAWTEVEDEDLLGWLYLQWV